MSTTTKPVNQKARFLILPVLLWRRWRKRPPFQD